MTASAATSIKAWDVVKLRGPGQKAKWLVVAIEGAEVSMERLGNEADKLVTSLDRIRPASR